ncbi:MAG: tRNA (adenosine(37)-N6)-threonylcarbamoyltransferase complex transferase subunit TsaD [Proteobacteria bacterium]|nr:tRNA (adenosine(37)-N6)-threonylcarbamoyltransferase complex transferase subunit TsaD [Pseudomonadota bacterium]
MKILALESSCDETAAAILEFNKDLDVKVLSDCVYTQQTEHQDYGGVVPEIASRAHLDKFDILIKDAISKADVKFKNLDAICATTGPGLLGGLLIGTMYAKSLALSLNIPFIPVNHLEGHALIANLTNKVAFPYLLLLASGGHCQFIKVTYFGEYEIIGGTIDDAAGEAFDKVGKMLGLEFPAGPKLENLAKGGDYKKYKFPEPLKHKGLDFSFSGLKTSVRTEILKHEILDEQTKKDIAASFQHTVVKLLIHKIKVALNETGLNNFVLAGGVAANKALRSELEIFCKDNNINLTLPAIKWATDNAVMIGYAGGIRYFDTKNPPSKLTLQAKPTPRWPLSELERVKI